MSNPITIVKSSPVNTLEELLKEYQRQYRLVQSKRKEAKELHLHNPFAVDYGGLQDMAISILQGQYGLTKNQAQLVDAKCYEDYHACYEDYLINLRSMAEFACKLLTNQ